ncbi:hypothetical protein CEXT_188211 [Caerostris extrusa]|uniref:Uncharacterized protein n=1 Tax=Caerostris extrusa TaxID=172846 RepID=A0AAV4TZT7_CAEEX|nr:hypothetical protein CEXT_188211 [Caerostris extrusa]
MGEEFPLPEASCIFPPDLRINNVLGDYSPCCFASPYTPSIQVKINSVLFCKQIELSKLLVDICILKRYAIFNSNYLILL